MAVAQDRLALKIFRRIANNLTTLEKKTTEANKAIRQAKSCNWYKFNGWIDFVKFCD